MDLNLVMGLILLSLYLLGPDLFMGLDLGPIQSSGTGSQKRNFHGFFVHFDFQFQLPEDCNSPGSEIGSGPKSGPGSRLGYGSRPGDRPVLNWIWLWPWIYPNISFPSLNFLKCKFLGVPLIVTPLFGDQNYNTYIVKQKETGVYINFKEISAKVIKVALKEVLYSDR
jgi:hypothetical protein